MVKFSNISEIDFQKSGLYCIKIKNAASIFDRENNLLPIQWVWKTRCPNILNGGSEHGKAKNWIHRLRRHCDG